VQLYATAAPIKTARPALPRHQPQSRTSGSMSLSGKLFKEVIFVMSWAVQLERHNSSTSASDQQYKHHRHINYTAVLN